LAIFFSNFQNFLCQIRQPFSFVAKWRKFATIKKRWSKDQSEFKVQSSTTPKPALEKAWKTREIRLK
jgi:hypothetical protein